MSFASLPELQALDERRQLVRIPPELDIPLTPRVKRLIDTAEFRRLAQISQLGLVGLVYPAANHTRFEHSLGVYRLALIYLQQLAHDPRFVAVVRPCDAELLIVGALLHDLGHWPFCHPIEDIRLAEVPEHEEFAGEYLTGPVLTELLRDDWGLAASDVVAFLATKPTEPAKRLLKSVLSGPIDIDKMDYLVRDSLHAGVPYGRNFDQQRLIGSLCVNAAGDGLAISDKGRTAAEMMVFARYVMFSEVYWHHAVRAATAMLQRAFYLIHQRLDLHRLFRLPEAALIAGLTDAARDTPAAELLDGLFGPRRRLFKRWAQFSFFEQHELYQRLTRRPYPWLVACAGRLAAGLSAELGREVPPDEILFDAPPVKREVEFNVDIHFPKEGCYRPLGAVSPVVQTLAQKQFDDYVKRVRIFVHPRWIEACRSLTTLDKLVHRAVDETDARGHLAPPR